MSATARPAKPATMPWLSPYLIVSDVARMIDFYQRAFGFELRGEPMSSPDGQLQHAELRHREAVVMLGPESPRAPRQRTPAGLGGTSLSLYLYVDDVDALYQRAVAAGAASLEPPADQFWGDRICVLTDPDGHHWTFARNVGDFDPSKAPR